MAFAGPVPDPALGGPALGLGGPGGLFGGGLFPGWSPYVPVTPLGGYEAFKGDLLYPMIGVGVAIFILIIIVLAVKAALVWKVELLESVFGMNKRVRSIDQPPAHDQDQMSNLATIVMSALDNQRCLEKIVCTVGSYGQGSSWPTWFSMMESLVSEDYRHSLSVLKSCAEGTSKMEDYTCGSSSSSPIGKGANGQGPSLAGQGAVKNGTGAANSTKLNNKDKSSPFNASSNAL